MKKDYAPKVQPLPFMWERNNPQHLKNFKSRKELLLNVYSGVEQPNSFSLLNFLGMLDYFETTYENNGYSCLHVYIAAYCNRINTPQVPDNYENMITLIFAPATSSGPDQKDLDYFFMPPGENFDIINLAKFKITRKIKKEWYNNYLNNLMPALLKTIDIDTSSNYDKNDNFSDTKYLTICKQSLDELVYEVRHIKHTVNGRPIQLSDNFIVQLVARGVKEEYEKRVFIQFDFTETNGTVFYLENVDDFGDRSKLPISTCESCTSKYGVPLLNKSKLCPPHCD